MRRLAVVPLDENGNILRTVHGDAAPRHLFLYRAIEPLEMALLVGTPGMVVPMPHAFAHHVVSEPESKLRTVVGLRVLDGK